MSDFSLKSKEVKSYQGVEAGNGNSNINSKSIDNSNSNGNDECTTISTIDLRTFI